MSSMKKNASCRYTKAFEKLRDRQCVYVDKTAYVYRLVHDVDTVLSEPSAGTVRKKACCFLR